MTLPGAVICGLIALSAATGVGAHSADPTSDEALRERVVAALHSDRYFYDAHVTVSVEKGDVVLHGFVTSDWDLLDAMRIARKAAGNHRVVNKLSLKLGELR
jgi:osmotically-inducible protein OsmY